MDRVSSPARLRPWSELTAKMVMGVVPGALTRRVSRRLVFESFWFWGGRPGRLGDFFLTFWAKESFDSSARRGAIATVG